MILTLRPNEKIRIEFESTDGAFEIEWSEGLAQQTITVWSELPGSDLGGAGIIYKESSDDLTPSDVKVSGFESDQTPLMEIGPGDLNKSPSTTGKEARRPNPPT